MTLIPTGLRVGIARRHEGASFACLAPDLLDTDLRKATGDVVARMDGDDDDRPGTRRLRRKPPPRCKIMISTCGWRPSARAQILQRPTSTTESITIRDREPLTRHPVMNGPSVNRKHQRARTMKVPLDDQLMRHIPRVSW